jgi:4-hydroxybutyrate CoA-transferase
MLIAACAKRVIAQINPAVPRCLGHSMIHINSIDFAVDVSGHPDSSIPCADFAEPGEEDMKIGKILSEMIPDSATLQVGIGAIPNAALRMLKNHKNLGIHSEMISDSVMELIECGAVNNSEKEFMAGRTVTSFLVGSEKLYDFVDDNPGIHLDTAIVTNTPRYISRNKRVVAINSAIEVDLTGQVCADSVGTRMISGVGGQLDFETGAAMSDGGIPLICLHSRSAKGLPSIVNTLQPGAGVTTTRYHAHWIVTGIGNPLF